MNYAYNVKANLKNKLYNFYEWKNDDLIEHFNRLKVFVVDDKTYDYILKMKVKVDESFLCKLSINKYTCIFTNIIDAVVVRFNNIGEIELISKLDLEEENELLDEINIKSKYKLKYKIINKSNNYSLNTRQEDEIIDYLNKYLKENKNNNELIDYLYYEFFKNNNSKNKYERLLKTINSGFTYEHLQIYNIIKLLV